MKIRVCKCPNCRTESPNVKDKIAFELGGEAFDCPKCGEKFATPKNSPLTYEVEEDLYENILKDKRVISKELISKVQSYSQTETNVKEFAQKLTDYIYGHSF
jgi:tRNA(Ile2) C34 agmatinyltransferase TiaS